MRISKIGVAIVAAFAVAYAGVAFAQAATDTTVRFDGLFGELRPYIMEVVSILIGAAVLWAAKKFHDLTGINIEAKHREALQSALKNGAKLAVDRAEKAVGNVSVDVHSKAAAAGINYVIESVPDAINYFGLTAEKLRELIEPKLAEAKSAVVPPAAAQVVVTVDGDGKIGAATAPSRPRV